MEAWVLATILVSIGIILIPLTWIFAKLYVYRKEAQFRTRQCQLDTVSWDSLASSFEFHHH